MKILFISIGSFADINRHEIYTDLVRSFAEDGDEVRVLCMKDASNNEGLADYGKIKIYRVGCDNLKSRNLIKKGLATVFVGRIFMKAFNKAFSKEDFDLIIYSTPPITVSGIVKKIKKKTGAKTYLLLKDIFPQNAVDLGMFSKSSIIYKYFRVCEKQLYNISDYIGCMSPANVKYLKEHNSYIPDKKIEINPNSIEITECTSCDRNSVLSRYNIPSDKTVMVYGGNLGKPQGCDFIMKCVDEMKKSERIHFVIAGGGTEYEAFRSYSEKSGNTNFTLIPSLATDEYLELVKACDIGLVFLDKRFTIPNYPSRILPYMQAAKPILAATDVVCDIKDLLEEENAGRWISAENAAEFYKTAEEMVSDADALEKMGINSYNALVKRFDVKLSKQTVKSHI